MWKSRVLGTCEHRKQHRADLAKIRDGRGVEEFLFLGHMNVRIFVDRGDLSAKLGETERVEELEAVLRRIENRIALVHARVVKPCGLEKKQPVQDIAKEAPNQFFGVKARKNGVAVLEDALPRSLSPFRRKTKLANVLVSLSHTPYQLLEVSSQSLQLSRIETLEQKDGGRLASEAKQLESAQTKVCVVDQPTKFTRGEFGVEMMAV